MLSRSNTKFLEVIYKEMCSSKRGELTIRSWELKDWPLTPYYQYVYSPSYYISCIADRRICLSLKSAFKRAITPCILVTFISFIHWLKLYGGYFWGLKGWTLAFVAIGKIFRDHGIANNRVAWCSDAFLWSDHSVFLLHWILKSEESSWDLLFFEIL